jgi:hypothetical protein
MPIATDLIIWIFIWRVTCDLQGSQDTHQGKAENPVEGKDWWLSGKERQHPPARREMPRSQYIDFAQDIADSTRTWGKWASILQLSANVGSASRRPNMASRQHVWPEPTALKTKIWETADDRRKTTNFVEHQGSAGLPQWKGHYRISGLRQMQLWRANVTLMLCECCTNVTRMPRECCACCANN